MRTGGKCEEFKLPDDLGEKTNALHGTEFSLLH